MQLAAETNRKKTHGAYVTGKVVLAQLIPVLNVLLWVFVELLNGDGHPADTGASRRGSQLSSNWHLSEMTGMSSGPWMNILQPASLSALWLVLRFVY